MAEGGKYGAVMAAPVTDAGPARAERSTAAPAGDRMARGMALGLVAIGILHFIIPGAFERIVPRLLGHARLLVYLSGVAEIVSGILVAVPRSRRTGALLAAATIVAVWPANWQMALDSGFPPRDAMGWAAWVRLPFQLPMVWVALTVARRAPA